jgi:2'-5' RNA ligase
VGEDGGVHHVDLVLDPAADAAVRAVWAALDEAGLPSLAHHRSPSNRPHTTLALSRSWPGAEGREVVVRALGALPMTVRLGAPLVFGHGPFVLALGVVPTQGLITLHRSLAGVLSPAREHLRPGVWTPHVTLAHRLEATQVGEVLSVVVAAGLPEAVTFDGARHWDAVGRLDEPLTGEGSSSVGG